MSEQDPFSDELLGQVLRTHRPVPTEADQDKFWAELELRLDQAPQVSSRKIVWLRSPWFAAAAAFAIILISFPALQQLSDTKSSPTNLAAYESDEFSNRDVKEEVAEPPMKLGAAAPAPEQEKQFEAKRKPESAARRLPQGQTAGLGRNELAKTRYPIPAGLVHVLQAYSVRLQSPAANVFDISLPESEHQAFEAALKQWAVSHQLEQRGLESGQVHYRLTLRTN